MLTGSDITRMNLDYAVEPFGPWEDIRQRVFSQLAEKVARIVEEHQREHGPTEMGLWLGTSEDGLTFTARVIPLSAMRKP